MLGNICHTGTVSRWDEKEIYIYIRKKKEGSTCWSSYTSNGKSRRPLLYSHNVTLAPTSSVKCGGAKTEPSGRKTLWGRVTWRRRWHSRPTGAGQSGRPASSFIQHQGGRGGGRGKGGVYPHQCFISQLFLLPPLQIAAARRKTLED